MMAHPPVMVNRKAAVYGDRLYIHSTLIADNEDPNTFESHKTIDVYNLQNHQYLYSFYIPAIGETPISNLLVCGNSMIVQYGKWLAAFRLRL